MNKQNFKFEASEEEYYMYFLNNIPQNPTGTVGYVKNWSNLSINVTIEVNDKFVEGEKSTTAVFYTDTENYISNSGIIITNEVFNMLSMGPDFYKAIIWHEIGHFHTFNKYYDKYGKNVSRTAIMAERKKRIMEGVVQDDEIEADLFAVKYCGKDDVVKMLNWMISKRKKQTWDENMDFAVKEFLNRKRIIRHLENE